MVLIRRARNQRTWLAAAAIGILALTGCSGSSSGGGTDANPKADHSETFHNITPRANQILQGTVPLMRGVESATYQETALVVRFRSTAEQIDRTNVENVVRQAVAKANRPGKKSAN